MKKEDRKQLISEIARSYNKADKLLQVAYLFRYSDKQTYLKIVEKALKQISYAFNRFDDIYSGEDGEINYMYFEKAFDLYRELEALEISDDTEIEEKFNQEPFMLLGALEGTIKNGGDY